MLEDTMLNPEHRGKVVPNAPADPEYTRQVLAYLQTEAQHVLSYRELAK